jgi:hypothetical protein
MTPSEGWDGEWYEKCFRNVKDYYDTSENENDVFEHLHYCGCEKHQLKHKHYQSKKTRILIIIQLCQKKNLY